MNLDGVKRLVGFRRSRHSPHCSESRCKKAALTPPPSHANSCSRYADDLIFSAVSPNKLSAVEAEVSRVLGGLDFPGHLRLNSRKTLHASRKGRRKITGVIITCDGQLSIGRSLKRQLRSEVFNWNRLDQPARKRLAGWLAHVRSLEPDLINALILKYGAERVISAMKG